MALLYDFHPLLEHLLYALPLVSRAQPIFKGFLDISLGLGRPENSKWAANFYIVHEFLDLSVSQTGRLCARVA
jgi:hypothetical protein